MIIDTKVKDLGGLTVRRALPQSFKRMIGPFIFFDHMGPVDFEIGNGIDVRPHPHIGLSTLTYLFAGEIIHRDTLGYEQAIQPGAVNWMTAGSGVTHSERSASEKRAHPQRLHGVQTWIALPREHEEHKPEFHHFSDKEIPEISYQGHKVRIIAGNLENIRSPVTTFSPLTYIHLEMARGSSLELPNFGHEIGVYCVRGRLDVNKNSLVGGQLYTPDVNVNVNLQIDVDDNSILLVLGGEPFPEERYIWWNFVSSSKDRLERAKADWRDQKFGSIQGETEFIPLPAST